MRDVALEAEVIQVAAVQARQRRHGQHLHVALRSGRGLHDALVTVHGREGDAAARQPRDGATDGGRHVEELQVDEYLLVACEQPVDQVEVAARHHQLEPELVESHRVAQPLGQRTRLRGLRDVHREYQAILVAHVVAHILSPVGSISRSTWRRYAE